MQATYFGWWQSRWLEGGRRHPRFPLSLFPSARSYSRAIADLVESMGWGRIAVLYEEEDAMASRLA